MDLKHIQELYDRHRFLEAYRETASAWSQETEVARLSCDELVLAGRLAIRLGGRRLSRWLFRAAQERDASNARVRYFTSHIRRRNRHLLERLREFENNPELGGGDAEVNASWFASHAIGWASLRDFETADQCLARAKAFLARDAWVLSCEADVRGMADRWPEALEAAEQAWEASPGAPYAAQSLGNSLLNLGRVTESAQRLSAAAESGESLEVAQIACWHLCALAETLEGQERRCVLERARALAEKMPALAPLADRESKRDMARARLDIAQLGDDHADVERWAGEARLPFFRRVLENLRQNPQGRRIRLPFRRALQKHQTCLPTSIASALAAMGVPMDAEAMAAEITFGGTYSWAAAQWLQEKDLAVRFFAVTPAVASDLIRHGIAFVFTLEGDESSHAVAAVGLDEAAGTLLVHDPQSFRTCEYLLNSIGEGHAPLGPEGMAVVPAGQAYLLDRLLPADDVEATTAAVAYQRALMESGPAAQRAVVEEASARQPSHPQTRLLQARQAMDEGRAGEALAAFQELLNHFPNSLFVRASLLAACRAMGNSARMREILANVVERGILPGAQSQQDWHYPPASHTCEYADMLRASATHRGQARRLLYAVLEREFASAGAWHVLGDYLWQEHDQAGYLLCYRLASCLASANDHYARAYCDALCEAGREGDGLAWLEKRVHEFGASELAAGTWMTWISALEQRGLAERALAACQQALQQHGDAPPLLGFAIPFLARMGHWEEAEAGLRRLEKSGNKALYCPAAVEFHRMRGELEAAIERAQEWVRECPQAMAARRQLLDAVARHDGDGAAITMAQRWSAERPGHDEFEELYCEQLDRRSSANWTKDRLLWRRVRRNPEDGWAWRELAFRYLMAYDGAQEKRQAKLAQRIEQLRAECDRTAPDEAATWRVHASWCELRGQRREAVAQYRAAIEAEPGAFYSYRHLWDCAAEFEDAERRALWRDIEPLLLSFSGRLTMARDMIFLVAQRFGTATAEDAANRWMAKRADDPDLIEAAVDLLLEHGHGRSDAARALAMLEPAVIRFPYHAGLRFSLARAYGDLGKFAEAEATFREIMRRHPDNSWARVRLAWIHERRNNKEEAQALLEAAAARDPYSTEVWDARAQMLIQNRRFPEARTVIGEALRRLPESVHWRERAIHLLKECGDEEGAVAAAREGVRIYPAGAYLWYLLGIELSEAPRFAAQGEIEACLRRSLALNAGLFSAADRLAVLLAEQRRYDDADEVLARILPRLRDTSCAQGRRAWIRRQRGEKAEALDDVAAVVRAAPWYAWGWRILMEWLAEDQAWDKARSVLNPLPPEMRTDTYFRQQRLNTLAKAGLPAQQLDEEWEGLLRDFPEDVPLHLWRYDALREEKREREAVQVLQAIRPLEPESPFVLARWVEALIDEGKHEEAEETLLRLWFAEVEPSAWPADYAWKAIQRPTLDKAVYARARQKLEQGARPTPQALSLMIAYAMERETAGKKFPQPFWRGWFPGAGAREVRALLEMVDRAPWDGAHARGALLNILCSYGYYRTVIGYRKRHKQAVDGDTESWAQAAHALVEMGRKREARRMLAGWRGRQGVGMWMITNYIACISRRRRKDLRAILETCRDALAGLPHDHCAKYLAHVQAEMCVALNDREGFRQTCETYQGYFTGELEGSEWFKPRDRYLLESIPYLARLLKENETKLFDKARRGLRWRQVMEWQYAKRPPATQSVETKIPWWVWWILIVGGLQAMRLFEK